MTIRGGHFFNAAFNLLLEYPRVPEHGASNSESLTAKCVEVAPEDKQKLMTIGRSQILSNDNFRDSSLAGTACLMLQALMDSLCKLKQNPVQDIIANANFEHQQNRGKIWSTGILYPSGGGNPAMPPLAPSIKILQNPFLHCDTLNVMSLAWSCGE